MPVCTGSSLCVPPEAGVNWTGAAVIQCQPVNYVGPWTLLLERKVGTTFQLVQKQVVQEPGFGATFDDTSAPPAQVTYEVCVQVDSTTAQCAASFTTMGPPNCGCEPTDCNSQTACNVTLDDGCGGTVTCGACANGMACNSYQTCCPPGQYSNGYATCVCAPPPGCPWYLWDTGTCRCDNGGP